MATKPCHNCRRRRLRCDRSLPQCHKCIKTGQECLGYQGLFLWNQGVASRGKMMGMTFEDMKQKEMKQADPRAEVLSFTGIHNQGIADVSTRTSLVHRQQSLLPNCVNGLSQTERNNVPSDAHAEISLRGSLTDPLFQDLNQDSRFYISYFASNVCKDLVIYDVPNQNPFRNLIPLTSQHPVLFHIIIANSALHLSNASQRSILTGGNRALPSNSRSSAPTNFTSSNLSRNKLPNRYRDALLAKQNALQLLCYALDDTQSAAVDVALATVLLFIELELMDSGKNNWKLHIDGARSLIDCLSESYRLDHANMSSLRRCLISNFLVYDILGSTLACLTASVTPQTSSLDVSSLLQYAEANNYLSCPAILLQIVLAAARLSQTDPSTPTPESLRIRQETYATSLLTAAQSFNPLAWSTALQNTSPHRDLESRLHVASAHKAAVCIYTSRVLLSCSSSSSTTTSSPLLSQTLEPLVSTVIHHLSFISPTNPLFKSTSWPTFVAGAETHDPQRQSWAVDRFHSMWELLPWGFIRSAVEVLEGVWRKRNAAVLGVAQQAAGDVDWIRELRMLEVDLLIA